MFYFAALCLAVLGPSLSFAGLVADKAKICRDDLSNRQTQTTLHQVIDEIRSRTDINAFTEISFSDLSGFTPLFPSMDFRGQGHDGIFETTYRGSRAFLKVSTRNVLQELINATILEKIGLGPSIYGWVKFNNRICLIYDFVEGTHMTESDSSWRAPFPLTQKTINRVRHMGVELHDAGFRAIKDLQIRITPNGNPLIVDSEFFYTGRPTDTCSLPCQTPEQATRELSDNLRSLLKEPPARK